MSQEANIPSKDIIPTLEAKIEKLVLENNALNSKLLTLWLEMKELQITEKETHDKWNKEVIESRIALEKEHFKRFIPTKKELGYGVEASTSHDAQPPNVSLGTLTVHPDVNI